VYLRVGNAAPDILARIGVATNLFSASIGRRPVYRAIRCGTFRSTPRHLRLRHAQPAVLFSLEERWEAIQRAGHAARMGQYYILDRRTGEPFTKVTEKPVPPSGASAAFQVAAATQPYSVVEPLTR